jgi:hypothetical protein
LTPPQIAVFVSPHGFGHAARASAVMEALHRLAGARFELFTSSPRWFYDESVEGLYRYHEVITDVGFKQRSALVQDVDRTVAALADLLPFDEALVEGLALEVKRAGCRAVLCDIASLGIAVAERAGLQSILVESFTWPWLYEPLFAEAPELEALAAELERWVDRVTVRIQTEPLCAADPRAELVVPPIGRPVRRRREEVRESLGVEADAPLVVLTMGGVPEAMPFLSRLHDLEDVVFLVTGMPETGLEGNVHGFHADTRIYMPDFVHAADAVVAKLGYSTVAEAWRERRPMAYVTRPDFRETAPVRDWVRREMDGFEIPGDRFAAGEWVARIPELLAAARGDATGQTREGGADTVARRVLEVVGARSVS